MINDFISYLYFKIKSMINYLKSPLKKQRSFTLVELMMVVVIVAVVLTIVFVLLNPKKQVEKSWDGKRKNDLNTLRKVFEDFYNDKGCYPKPEEVCYGINPGNPCQICGTRSDSPSFSPYLNPLPCDPQSPRKEYLYQVDNISCPQWYRVYSKLSREDDSAVSEVGCQNGCGPAPEYAYSYGVSSPNIDLETGAAVSPGPPTLAPTITTGPQPTPTPRPTIQPTPTISLYPCPPDPEPKYCISGTICNNCGTFKNCTSSSPCNQPIQLYLDYQCLIPCEILNDAGLDQL